MRILKRLIFLFLSLFLLSFTKELVSQSIQFEHVANNFSSIKDLSLGDQKITFSATQAGNAFVVIYSKNPIQISSSNDAEAKLIQGWDGSLGYSLYGLELKFSSPGTKEVLLYVELPPEKAIPTSGKDKDKFLSKLNNRSSKFPNELIYFEKWKLAYQDSLKLVLTGNKKISKMALDPLIIYEVEYEKFKLLKFEFNSQIQTKSTALLSLPKGVSKAPLIVALHGHETTWGDADSGAFRYGHIDDFCSYFANRGWAVIQPATMDHTLKSKGKTLQGQWTIDAINALDFTLSFPEIDTTKVAVCGLSTGGHLAMNLLALDKRIQAGVIGSILSTWNHYENRFRIPPHCDCGIYNQLSPLFKQCDWAALAAPKPVMYQHGRLDAAFCPGADPKLLDLEWNTGIMPPIEYDAQFDEIIRAYTILDCENFVTTFYHQGPHSIHNKAAYNWLMQAFQIH